MSSLNKKLINIFGSYQDFPEKGIIFCDILPVLRDIKVFDELIESMSKASFIHNSDALIAIDARGFIFGTAIAYKVKKPLVLARKPGKLPGEVFEESYSLEYGENRLCIQKESIKEFKSFSIIDDLLATGGTARCVEKLLKDQGKLVNGLSVVVELANLEGYKNLECDVICQVKLD
tara:strand:- start:1103 stop:1630 length:528 start_codon:yes stop_codon:yes gene_type:complete